MRFVIRFDVWNGDHVTFTVFSGREGSAAMCGALTMRLPEYQAFVASLIIGSGMSRGVVHVVSDDMEFREKALEAASRSEVDREITVEPSPHVYADILLNRRVR